eukprot:m.122473 g.122473  ORF g.122473 m.122473 type:complete len:463 (+) comp37785_c0_seq1:239-1627(+)
MEPKGLAKCLHSLEDLLDSLPVVGHVKGAIHYATGDREHGDKCMKDASKSTVSIGAMVAVAGTGGAAAPLVAGAVAVTSSTVMDGVITGIDSAVHDEYRPYGEIAAIGLAVKTKDAVHIANAILAPIGEFGMAAAFEIVGRKAKAARDRKNLEVQRYSAAKNAANTFRKSVTRKTKKSGGSSVATVVKNTKTKKSYVGVSSKARYRVNPGKAKSMLRGIYKSALQRKVGIKKSALKRDPKCCAEHPAYDSFYKDNTTAGNAVEVSVKRSSDGRLTVVDRCENCKQYAPAMGEVSCDLIGTDMTDPVSVQHMAAALNTQLACLNALPLVGDAVSGLAIANMPGNVSIEVKQVKVCSSRSDQRITRILFSLWNGREYGIGEKELDDDQTELHDFSLGERITALSVAGYAMKMIGLALHVGENVVSIGRMNSKMAEVQEYDASPDRHIVGLEQGEGRIVVLHSNN